MKKLLAIIPLTLATLTVAQARDAYGYAENDTATLTGQVIFRTAHDEEGEKITYPALILKEPIRVKYEINKAKARYVESGRYVQLMVDTMPKLKHLQKKKGKTITVTCDLGVADSGGEFTPVNCVMFGDKHP